MKKKKREKKPRMEDLIPDPERRAEVLRRMYNGDPVVGQDGIFTDLLQAMINAALEGEMDAHLEEEKATGAQNRRNGHNTKQIRSRVGPMEVQTPRDRSGTHKPMLVGKWDRELSTGMDEVILSLYARGNSVEDVRSQLRELYGVEVSAGTISRITDRVLEEITNWQQRPLDPCYSIVYLDAIHFKIRQEGKVCTKAVYSVYGVTAMGNRDLLGMYLSESEGARYWGLILEDIKRRGVEEVLFFCVDGLTGFKEVIADVFPQSTLQRCVVHMVRSSTKYVSYKHIREVCSDLRKIYTSANRDQAAIALESFGQKWDSRYKEIRPKWEQNWEELMAFMDYKPHIRRMIYTTNPVEALHRIMRKVTKSKGAWVSENALIKQLYLFLMTKEKSWKKQTFKWVDIQRELLDQFGERYEKYT